jgi:hypothetical protein
MLSILGAVLNVGSSLSIHRALDLVEVAAFQRNVLVELLNSLLYVDV